MKCEECETKKAKSICLECDQLFCSSCDSAIHKGGRRKVHFRQLACEFSRHPAKTFCRSCSANICKACGEKHIDHTLDSIRSSPPVAVFWDLHSCRPVRPDDVSEIVSGVYQMYSNVEFIKGYGEMFSKWQKIFEDNRVELCNSHELKASEAMILDISICAGRNTSDILILTSKVSQIKAHLLQLITNVPDITIEVSSNIYPISPVYIQDIPHDIIPSEVRSMLQEAKSSPLFAPPEQSFSKVAAEHLPGNILQKFPPKRSSQVLEQILTIFKNFAEEGQLIHEFKDVTSELQERLDCTLDQVVHQIKQAERLKLLNVIKRQFGTLQTVNFVSLNLTSISLQSLLWVLRSLKNDEMIPTERAVLSRMKEVFDYKPEVSEWNDLIQTIHITNAARNTPFPRFNIQDIIDSTSGSETFVIYPEGEEWTPLDQHTKSGDTLSAKGTEEWESFIRFLEGYFAPEKQAKQKGSKKFSTESKAIPGGRYGCAQFVKMCGPANLRDCSLGRLSYMVQLAINDDLLRYQRTLLVWTPLNAKMTLETESMRRLNQVKTAIVNLLYDNTNGISLAQLPLYLKRMLPFQFDLSEFGFAKLKDLLNTIPEVMIELRGSNHPFAKHISFGYPARPSIETILQQISQILIENNFGLTSTRLETLLFEKTGSLNWKSYGAQSISDFTRQWSSKGFEVVSTGPSTLIRIDESKRQVKGFRSNFSSKPPLYINHSSSLSTDYYPGSASHFAGISGMQFTSNPAKQPDDSMMNRRHYHSYDYEEGEQHDIMTVLYSNPEALSSTLQGPFPPRYQTDSVEYHSREPSMGFREFKEHTHGKASSQGWMEDNRGKSRQLSWFGSSQGPPPGFHP